MEMSVLQAAYWLLVIIGACQVAKFAITEVVDVVIRIVRALQGGCPRD
jgi:hypothetical protein